MGASSVSIPTDKLKAVSQSSGNRDSTTSNDTEVHCLIDFIPMLVFAPRQTGITLRGACVWMEEYTILDLAPLGINR